MSGQVVHVLGSYEFDEYVGRAMPRYGLKESWWANPYKIGEDGTREEVLEKFEDLIRRWLTDDPEAAWQQHEWLRRLHGKTLACWCSPRDGVLTTEDETVCHAQIVLRLADELAEKETM